MRLRKRKIVVTNNANIPQKLGLKIKKNNKSFNKD